METVLYIIVLIIALAFAGGVIFLAKILTNLTKTLSNVADMIESVKGPVQEIAAEGANMLHMTNKLAEDFNEKASRLNPIVDGYKGIGEEIIEFNNTVKTASHSLTTVADQNKNEVAQVLNFGIAGFHLYQQYKNDDELS